MISERGGGINMIFNVIYRPLQEPEPTQFGRNRSRLRYLRLPEPPKKSGGSATLAHSLILCRITHPGAIFQLQDLLRNYQKKGVLYRYLSVTLSTTPHCTTQR